MMTLSGRYVTLDSGAPSLSDIAVGLSREGRFSNQTLVAWNVAQHSLLCLKLVGVIKRPAAVLLDILLHDAAECVTRDICTDFKTDYMKEIQDDLDHRIYHDLGVGQLLPRTPEQRSLLKWIDQRALLAEACVVTPGETYRRICSEQNGPIEAHPADVDAVYAVMGYTPSAEAAATDFRFEADYLLREVRSGN